MAGAGPRRPSERDLWWDRSCQDLIPRAVAAATGDDARAIGADIARRGREFAGCGTAARDALIAPFVEEAIHLRPAETPLSVRSAVVVVVRGGLVGREHARGRLRDTDLVSLMTVVADLLLTFLATQPAAPQSDWLGGEYAGLSGRYPHAWAACVALFQALVRGGGTAHYRVTIGTPARPADPEEVASPPSGRIPPQREPTATEPVPDPRAGPEPPPRPGPIVDGRLASRWADLETGRDEVLAVPSLSWISRRHDELLRVIELTLARGRSVLTTNYLLRPASIYVRSGRLAVPARHNHAAGFADQRGLVDVHRACAEAALAKLAEAS
jgi:hypothetical protein